MGGAGTYPAGFGPPGFAPVVAADPPDPATYPRSILLDGATRDFTLDAKGRYVDLHPVDQKVALALLVAKGKLAADSSQGQALASVTFGTDVVNKTTTTVREAVADIVAANEISIIAIEVDAKADVGAIFVAFSYLNLITQKTGDQTIRTGT